MTENYIHNLDKNIFFYDSIVTLAYTQFGINELFSRGFFILKMKEYPDRSEFVNHINEFDFPAEVKDQIFRTRTFTPQIFVPGFRTKDTARDYRMDTNTSAVQFVIDTAGITDKNIELTHLTIIVAWEKILSFNLADTPVWQFFRHIRNAAAHNGKFHFTNKVLDSQTGELLKEAKWGNFEIKASFHDLPLILKNKNDTNSFWDQGDLVEFLLDFENHYPELKAPLPII
ncbi:hypothetical protein SNE26_09995 [Mucilaginibacter sp. cycad4]|uniref:hypothetical protein n=1 Tax=Mucilaginibacter sp. cycad4 TaxID=3342096 RepID=UPI002AAC173B|nr:hypothetical protein [Mucilaginibacter gossypii]WPV02106.1 hypothetical protein SNE26_09995 [Mucilaginibacter gossypii]